MSKQSIDIGADTFYTIYKTTNNITNKTYIGQHITNNINDSYLGSGTFNSGGQFSKWLKETLNIDISNTAINAITHINRIDNIIKRNSTSFEKIYGSVFFTHIVENKLTPRQLGWGGIYK
jgi:hypothetical protein